MNEMLEEMELWKDLLHRVHQVFPAPILAGGAVRDLLVALGPPRDYDIFVNVADEETLLHGLDRLNTLGIRVIRKEVEFDDQTDYEEAPDWKGRVSGVLEGCYDPPSDEPPSDLGDFDFEAIGPLPFIQIIGRPLPPDEWCPERLVSEFDIGLTQTACWLGRDGQSPQLYWSEAFMRDRVNKTLTITRWNSPEHVAVTHLRIKRFLERNQGWTVVAVPPSPDSAPVDCQDG